MVSAYVPIRIDADFAIEVGRVVPSASATVLTDGVVTMCGCVLTNDCDRKLPDPPQSIRNIAAFTKPEILISGCVDEVNVNSDGDDDASDDDESESLLIDDEFTGG